MTEEQMRPRAITLREARREALDQASQSQHPKASLRLSRRSASSFCTPQSGIRPCWDPDRQHQSSPWRVSHTRCDSSCNERELQVCAVAQKSD